MAKVFSFSVVLRTILSGFLLSACQSSGSEKLTVAAAANTQFAMEEIGRKFTETTGIACQLIFGSSGKLTTQIMEGAPFDVFVSADMNYPEKLFQAGYSIAAPEVYAHGRLILWNFSDSRNHPHATDRPHSRGHPDSRDSAGNPQAFVNMLTRQETDHIALPNPKTAPYGVAAVEALKYYGIYNKVKKKLVYGESVSQTNHFIISKVAAAGFTALSVIKAPIEPLIEAPKTSETDHRQSQTSHWQAVDTAAYSPITQGAVLLKSGKNAEKAQKFYDFLFSESGQRILFEHGYIITDK